MDDTQALLNRLNELKEDYSDKEIKLIKLQNDLDDLSNEFTGLDNNNSEKSAENQLVNEYLEKRRELESINSRLEQRYEALDQLNTKIESLDTENEQVSSYFTTTQEEIKKIRSYVKHSKDQYKGFNKDNQALSENIKTITNIVDTKSKEFDTVKNTFDKKVIDFQNKFHTTCDITQPNLINTFQPGHSKLRFQMTSMSLGFNYESIIFGTNEPNIGVVSFKDVDSVHKYSAEALPNAIKTHPTEQVAYIVCNNGLIWKYDFFTSAISRPFAITAKVNFYDFDFAGRFLVAASSDRTLKVFDTTRPSSVTTVSTPFQARSLSSNIDDLIFCGCNDGSVAVFDVRSKTIINKSKSHDHNVISVASPLLGYEFYSMSLDRKVKCYDTRTFNEIFCIDSVNVTDPKQKICVCPSGKYFALTDGDNTFNIYDKNGKNVYKSPDMQAQIVGLYCAENMLVIGDINQKIQFWDFGD